jgi:hypothetical protein
MKNKHKSLLSVIAIACAVGVPLSLTTAHELPVQAAYSKPSDWDFGYYLNTSTGDWELSQNVGSVYYNPKYVKTGTSPNIVYTATFTSTTHPNVIPTGVSLEVKTTNDSSGQFYDVSGGSVPDAYPLGGSNNRLEFSILNYTNQNYEIYLDFDGTTEQGWQWKIDGNNYYDGHYQSEFLLQTQLSFNGLVKLPLFAQSTFVIFTAAKSVSLTNSFNGLYLNNIGTSAAYDANAYDNGYDAGYDDGLGNNPNVLINAFESLIGMMVNFTFILFTLEMFGVSILSIVGVLFGLITIVWILKTIRG